MRQVYHSDKKDYRYGESTSKTQDNIKDNDTYNTSNTIYSNMPSSSNKILVQNSNSNIDALNNINIMNSQPMFDISDLVYSIHDDFKTILNKNNRLRNILIQASNKMNELSTKSLEREEEYRLEKAGVLDQLDKITENYKKYAEGYKNFTLLEEQLKNLQNDYNHNYKVLTTYQESIKYYKIINS
jgi:hypothetical protein